MSLSFNNVGININETKIQVVELNNNGDEFKVENIDEEYFPELLNFDDKEGKIIDILQSSFNEILLRNEFKSNTVSLALPPIEFKVFQIPLEKRLSRQDKEKYLKWEFARLFPYASADNFVIKYFTAKEDSEKNSEEICAFAVKGNLLRALNKFFALNKMTLKYADHAHLAALNVLRAERFLNSNSTLNVYLGSKSLSIIFAHKCVPVSVKTIEFNNVAEIPERFKSVIEITESLGLNKYEFSDGFISGEAVSDTLLMQLKEDNDITLKKINPFSGIKVADRLKDSAFVTEKYNSFTAACGMALRLS